MRNFSIIYDSHIFRWQQTGGISRYFFEIISRLPSDWQPNLLGVGTRNHAVPRHPRLVVSDLSSVKPRRITQEVKKTWWKSRYVANANLFHPTYYCLVGGLQFRDISCPIVVTVHDFIKARYPELESDSMEAVRQQREAITHATHLICVSNATERDLLEYYPHLQGRTSVIYHGSSFPICADFFPNEEEVLATPVFVFVGRRATYKNFAMLLRAFAKACQSHPGIRLRVAGPPLSDDERWQIHFLGISHRVDSTVFPDELTLQNLYRTSIALLYPSRHEGFGIPPLEAMACGTLAITSNTTSLPEVVGDAGIMLDPTNEDVWADCILMVANAKINRAELIERGRRRAETLTWEASARSHIEIYKRVA